MGFAPTQPILPVSCDHGHPTTFNPSNPGIQQCVSSQAARRPCSPSLCNGRNEVYGFLRGCPRLRTAGNAVRPQEQRYQTGPAGLMRGAETAAGIAVKILIEQHVIAEV